MTCPLGLIVLVHQRPQLIPLIVEQVMQTWPGARIDFAMDRPSIDVETAVHAACLAHGPAVRCFAAPFPALTHKEQYIELRQWQLEKMNETLAGAPAWMSMWDDDHILERPEEARAAMESTTLDLLYVPKVYLWDTLDQQNVGLPHHNSITFFRNLPGQRWERMVGAPSPMADHMGLQLQHPLLDVGYLTAAERSRVWKAYSRAGKIDALTLGVISPHPELAPFESDSPWHQRLKEVLHDAL